MDACKVTVTRTVTLLVGRPSSRHAAQEFVRDLLDLGEIGEGAWGQEMTVEPYVTTATAGKEERW